MPPLGLSLSSYTRHRSVPPAAQFSLSVACRGPKEPCVTALGPSGALNGAMQPHGLLFSLLSACPSIGCSCSPTPLALFSSTLSPAAALHPFSELQHISLFLDCILSFRPQLMTLGDLLLFSSPGNEATPQEQKQAAFVFLESVPRSRIAGTCVVVFLLWKFLAGF